MNMTISSLLGLEHFFKPAEKTETSLSIPLCAPSIKLNVETKNYTLSTKATREEMTSLFSLRQQVFFPDSDKDKLDIDEFDSICDHIIIREKKTNEIVGTYRVNCSKFSGRFYSSTEFNTEEISSLPGVKLELGRAAISESHRNGHVIDLLWRGIGEYMDRTNSRWLFGCSSVKTLDNKTAFNLSQYFILNQFEHESLKATPLEEFQTRADIFIYDENKAKKTLPPLLRTYLNAGAKIIGTPAKDRSFGCFDYLTLLDKKDINSSYKRRYFK